MFAANGTASRIALRYRSPAGSECTMGRQRVSIIAVVAVLLSHIDRNAVMHITPMTSRGTDRPVRAITHRAIRSSS